jgi:2-hydroxy-3-keto-5-methylthiopentenyl-1-phosphate phosphatase
MAPKITVKRDYILVEHKEVDFGEIREGIEKLRELPESSEKSDIWVFKENRIKLDYVDLQNLKEFVKKIYSKNVTMSKTAIVVESGMQSAIALLFSQITENLPFEIKVFIDFQAAEDWVTNK